MANKSQWRKFEQKKGVEVNEREILKKFKNDLITLQKSLRKNNNVNDVKDIVNGIDRLLQWKIENNKETKKVFEKLTELKKSIDEKNLKNKINELANLLENLTKNDLLNLSQNVIEQQNNYWLKNRPINIQKWIKKASKDLETRIQLASRDKNPIARQIGKWMEYLIK